MTRPVIGIGSDVTRNQEKGERAFAFTTYVEALRRAGAVALIVPPQPENAASILDVLDGLLLAGGADCDPAVYGEERHSSVEPMDERRQTNDLALAKIARQRGIPTLGVCLGAQVMNVAAGGALVQDIVSQVQSDIRHAGEDHERVRHGVVVSRGNRLSGILGEGELEVNSSHHQAVGRVAEGLSVIARAADGVVEALEDPRHPFYLGVQWHPEDMVGELPGDAVFAAFVEAARRRAELKNQATEMSPAVAERSE